MSTCCIRSSSKKVKIQIKNVMGTKEACWNIYELTQYSGLIEDEVVSNATYNHDDDSCTFSVGGFTYRLYLNETCVILQ